MTKNPSAWYASVDQWCLYGCAQHCRTYELGLCPPRYALPVKAKEMPSLLQLRSRQCRYPLTQESPWLFCGRETADGRSYCGRHYKLCVKGSIRALECFADYINRTDSMSAPSRDDDDRVRPLDEMVG